MPMVRKLVIAAALLLAGCITPPSPPDTDYLLKWIEANSDYRNIPPPKRYALLTNDLISTPGMTGGYSCAEQTIYLPYDTGYRDSTIVHELTHHAQCVNGRLQNDACAREREAYAIEAKYDLFLTTRTQDPVYADYLRRISAEIAAKTPPQCR